MQRGSPSPVTREYSGLSASSSALLCWDSACCSACWRRGPEEGNEESASIVRFMATFILWAPFKVSNISVSQAKYFCTICHQNNAHISFLFPKFVLEYFWISWNTFTSRFLKGNLATSQIESFLLLYWSTKIAKTNIYNTTFTRFAS